MSDKMFYPECFGLSKAKVMDMVNERIGGDDPDWKSHKTLIPKIDLLTDNLMQLFVDKWYKELDNVVGIEYPNMGDVAQAQEKLLKDLAVLIGLGI